MMAKRFLTVDEILDDLGREGKPLSRRTWDRWRETKVAPKCVRLPNGELRVHRSDYETWLMALTEAA